MAHQPQRSLRHEYELFVEQEIENYKDTISRSSLLAIGDEAVASLAAQAQFALTEMLLWEEVDRLIARRLRIPTYRTWRARRTRLQARYRSPEHWGLRPEEFLVREVQPVADGHVLVAGASEQSTALYLAANGAAVTTLEPDADAVDRVMMAADAAGLTDRVRGYVSDLVHWEPDVPLSAFVCSAAMLVGLSEGDPARALDALQRATRAGGVHLVRASELSKAALDIEALRESYHGWRISEELSNGLVNSFLARKELA
jgi:hypothetical protein